MEPISITLGVVVAGIAGYKLVRSMYVRTPQYTSKIIAGFGGAFKRTTQAGGSWKAPYPIERVAYEADLTLQVTDFDVNIKTKDDNFVDLPIQIHYEIADAIKSARLPEVAKRKQVMQTLAQNVIRSHFAGGDLQAVYTTRDEMASAVRTELQKNMEDYGLTIRDVVVENPKLPADLQTSMQNVVIADRNLEASRKNAEAIQVKLVAEAKGKQAVMIAEAEGKKAALLAQAEGEGAIAIAKARAEKEARTMYGQGVAAEQEAIAEGFHRSVESMTAAGITPAQAMEYIQTTNNRQLDRQIAEGYATAYGKIPNAILFADVPSGHAKNTDGVAALSTGGTADTKELVKAVALLRPVIAAMAATTSTPSAN